jgi:hypothetical protein
MRIVVIVLGALVALFGLLIVGRRITPKPLAPYGGTAGSVSSVPLPHGLPAPVDRFYRNLYGDEIPVYTSAVISARASMRVNGITLPARIRFTHDAGQGYRHYIEATWFGIPILKIDERYLDGSGVMELPFGTLKGSKVDQGANLGLWAETVWLASVWITDPRTRWEPVDEETALLYVPFKDEEQTLLVRFDPATGLVSHMESMRYKGAEANEKTLWINVAYEWDELGGQLALTGAGLTWLDEGSPWAAFALDGIVYNSDVTEYIRAKGP